MENNINKIKKLKNSLIYKMSLGSKELYHSNVWAWLIENDPSFINIFIKKKPAGFEFVEVIREEKHRDLTLHFKNGNNEEKCIVIENKLKSIPDEKQLKKYTDDLGKNFCGGILTGLILPNIFNGSKSILLGKCRNKAWKFIPYSEISEQILKNLKKSKNKIILKNKLLIEEYCNNIKLMEQVVNNTIIPNNLYVKRDYELDNLGLLDLIKKVNGSLFINYVEEKLKKDNISHGNLILRQSFHNKKTTLDFRLEIGKDDKRFCCGIQIEGTQFRRIVDKRTKSLEDLFKTFVNCGFFDGNYKPETKKINWPKYSFNDKNTSMSKPYDKYGNTVVYQYVNIKNYDFGHLYNLIKENLELSIEVFNTKKYN